MSTVDPVLATGTFCAVPRETRDRFVSLREGPGPKFRETRRVTPSDLLRVATERCRDGFGPTQCSLDGKWSFVADVTTASGGHARLQKGWARSTLLRHVACADDRSGPTLRRSPRSNRAGRRHSAVTSSATRRASESSTSPRGEFPQFAFHRPMAASSTGSRSSRQRWAIKRSTP